MQLKDIALNNIRRRRIKIIFLVFGMVFGIATIVTLFTITSSMEAEVAKSFEKVGSKILVEPKTDTVSFSVGGIPVAQKVSYDVKDIPESAVKTIKSIPDGDQIKVVAPKVLGKAVIDGNKLALVGVDMEKEFAVKTWWEVEGKRPREENEVLLGVATAKKLNKKTGDTLVIEGRDFKVSGVLRETGSEEDGLVFLELKKAQEILNKKGTLSFIEISVVKNDRILKDVVKEISSKIPEAKVLAVKEAAEARKELVDRFAKFSAAVSLIMLLIGSLIVMTTMMSSVNERTREIGIFRAIGFRKSHIMKIILLEAAIVSGISGFVGYLVGIFIALFAGSLISQVKVQIGLNPILGIIVISAAILVGVAASIYPASKAARLDPVEALRFI